MRIHLCSSICRRAILAAFIVAAALAGPASGAAQNAPARPATWAGEWAVLGPQVAAGTLSGLERQSPGGWLRPIAGAASGKLESPAHDMGHEFMALGALWRARAPAGSALSLEVRTSVDGLTWEGWQTLAPDAGGPDGTEDAPSHSELMAARGRYVQVRASLAQGAAAEAPGLESLKLVAIDAGASEAGASTSAAAASVAPVAVISRAGWGANEAYMTWTPKYAPVSHVVIHHTTGSNASVDADPAAFVRAIYYYHAVTLGWGDIGYNFLIDRQGRVYEGRKGGDGVIGGHALQYNTGSVGVAIMGDYSKSDVPPAAVTGLEKLIAWKCDVHGINPLTSSWLVDRTLPHIMGHRDCNSTTCPGDRAYALLPQIRSAVDAYVHNAPPQVTLTRPVANAALGGVSRVSWQTSWTTTMVKVAVDGQARASLPPSMAYWPWNTTLESDGSHVLRVTAIDGYGQSTSVEVTVRVDNTPPSGGLAAPLASSGGGVTLSLSCEGCTRVQVGSGWRWEGEDLRHNTGSAADDPAAANGRAWEGQVGVDRWGAWYGPYFCGLPTGAKYEASFWLRAEQTGVVSDVARLDVVDAQGARLLGGTLAVAGTDFARPDSYQRFAVPFSYPDRGTSCSGTKDDGLELRTWFQGAADLWLDRVEIFLAPQRFAKSLWFALPQAEGRYTVEVRFLDAAGNVSPVYTRTVAVDRTAPIWGEPSAGGLPVADGASGLADAAYAISDDGKDWGPWVPVAMTLAPDGLSGTIPPQPDWEGRCLRARVRDLAGNTTYSAPIGWPTAADQKPEYRWWGPCGWRTYYPLVRQ